jgi:SAM-dependent methyltransferase
MNVAWDYTELAHHYDKRADYSASALDRLCAALRVEAGASVADIGAGTGKLAVPLARRGLRISAVEPNAAMRTYGARNSEGLPVVWSEGAGERTGLASGAFDLVTFGSSFNVVDQAEALVEVARILKPSGGFACMWNHRDLDDPLQSRIEALILAEIPEYSYGKRREDPTPAIDASRLFGAVGAIEERFIVQLPAADYVDAWRSHGTLQRQAGAKFGSIVEMIEREVGAGASAAVPYCTRIWHARRNNGALN